MFKPIFASPQVTICSIQGRDQAGMDFIHEREQGTNSPGHSILIKLERTQSGNLLDEQTSCVVDFDFETSGLTKRQPEEF